MSPSRHIDRKEYRFTLLLGTLLLMLLAGPIVARYVNPSNTWAGTIVFTTIFSVTLLASVFAISDRHRRVPYIAIGLVLPCIAALAIDLAVRAWWSHVAANLAIALFIGYVSFVMITHIFHAKRVTIDTVSSSLCVYLLIAVLWAQLYSALELAVPGSFHFKAPDDASYFAEDESMVALYYSLVTMTTLGYGDIVPRIPEARMLASVQATFGQIYMAVIVARLVAMEIAESRDRKSRDED